MTRDQIGLATAATQTRLNLSQHTLCTAIRIIDPLLEELSKAAGFKVWLSVAIRLVRAVLREAEEELGCD